MIKLLGSLTVLLLCSTANAQCLDAFKAETGLSLDGIEVLEAALGAEAKIGPMPKGDGAIFTIPAKTLLGGQQSDQTLGYLTGRKVSAITLGFATPLDAAKLGAKYGLQAKMADAIGTTFQCEPDISFFVGRLGKNNGAMIKSVREVDAIMAANR